MQKLILAVDPGYDRCGVAIVDASAGVGSEKLVFSHCIETDKKKDFYQRLLDIADFAEALMKKYDITHFAIEKLFFNTNQKTASKVSEVRGVLLYLARKYELTILEYTPLQIKLAITGNGRADKRAVYEMLPKIIKIEKNIKLDDEFDAIACGLTASVVD